MQDGGHAAASQKRLERNLGLFLLCALLVGCFFVVRPFLTAILWAIVLCFSLWPIYQRLLAALGGRRTWAALILSTGMIVVILLPFVIIGATLADSVKEFSNATRNWLDEGPPQPPLWLDNLPFVGDRVAAYWKALATDNARLWREAKQFVEPLGSGLLRVGLALGRGVLEIGLSIFISFFLFRDGVAAAEHLKTGVGRLAGERGQHLLEVAGNTVRGVVYGILGTALVQAMVAGLGFLIAGVPGAALLALLTFFFSVVPMGPPLVWVPASIWLFKHGSPGWGVFMLVWGFGVSSVDNFVRPWLISQGSALPFILIFFGVLGGAIAFGFIGVFLGPTLLAVVFRLVKEWAAVRNAAATGGAEFAEEPRDGQEAGNDA